jgi:hypothetical protein
LAIGRYPFAMPDNLNEAEVMLTRIKIARILQPPYTSVLLQMTPREQDIQQAIDAIAHTPKYLQDLVRRCVRVECADRDDAVHLAEHDIRVSTAEPLIKLPLERMFAGLQCYC